MRCHLYCEGQNLAAVQKTYSRNNGIAEVLLNPKAFRYEGCELQLFDTRALTEKDRVDMYITNAMWPAAKRHYEVKPMFGTGRYTGLFFGSQVPALVVVADSGEVLDIYPHRTSGREVTIREVPMPAVS